MEFADLHPKFLLLILEKNFPLQEALFFRSVCHQWNDVVLKLCRSQKSLKLFYSFQEVYNYATDLRSISRVDHEDFKLSLDSVDFVLHKGAVERMKSFHYRALGRLFPNLVKLVVANPTDLVVPAGSSGFNVSRLLENWPDLNSFVFFGMKSTFKQEEFWTAIQSLTSLKRFHLLRVSGSQFVIPPPIYPILKQLEYFTLVIFDYQYDFPLNMTAIWKQFGPAMKQVVCEPFPCNLDQMKDAFACNRDLDKMSLDLMYVSVTLFGFWKQVPVSRFLCQKISSLTHLTILVSFNICYLELISLLAPLKQLTELRFHVDEDQPKINRKKATELSPLSSVKHLMIGYFKIPFSNPIGMATTRRGLLFQSFAILFPKMEQMSIKNFAGGHISDVDLLPYIQILRDRVKSLQVVNLGNGIENGSPRYCELYHKFVNKHGKPIYSHMLG